MIPNVTRGDRMHGLVNYLAGGGRHNEHTDQHVLAGDDWTEIRFTDTELDRSTTAELARQLDNGAAASGVRMKGGHVWHCSLAISKHDGVLSDDEWHQIAHEFIEQMGFDDAQGAKGACMWAAVRHGLSGKDGDGNDHIHIAVNLVRTDGTKAWIHNDFRRAQQACRKIEQEHGLEELGIDRTKAATRGWKPGEREAQARRRARAKLHYESPEISWGSLPVQERQRLTALQLQADQPRNRLADRIRAAASQSHDEAEFVRRLRRQGVLLRPRYAQGDRSVVTGYSVAERPMYGERPIWYGGGTIARDLRLPVLRQGWTDSIAAAGAAADEWNAALRNKRVVHPGQDDMAPLPQDAAAAIARLNNGLKSVSPDDRETWAHVAHETAGALASWSRAVESTPGPIAYASRTLARSAQTYSKPQRPPHAERSIMSGAALAFVASLDSDNPRLLQSVMYRQIFKTADMIRRAMDARNDAYLARITLEAQKDDMMRIAQALPAGDGGRRRTTAPPTVTRTADKTTRRTWDVDELVHATRGAAIPAGLSATGKTSPPPHPSRGGNDTSRQSNQRGG
ncbi:relaxase/mobilization nuclease domain-containing protein [Bifidobacterium xylocopae]|uniref:Relaxase n=1 Tax=Bifidobacterium xylocopae TaxID=2493119 RepID=A0A366KC93_9BIFI|nr:relaxase/mobilization nuclease domain-containing protein [Bifidobacterium xylocopae]RBP98808.1 relaxase [Bifidobacterium xylocopae]